MEDKTQEEKQHEIDPGLAIDNIEIAFFASIADEAGTICVEHEDVRAVQNIIRYYLTQNK